MNTDDPESFEYCDDLFTFKDVEKESLSTFDKLVREKWNFYMDMGFFRYHMKTPDSKILKGKFGYLAQLQTNRANLRRQPQSMTNLRQPFDKNQFNFAKINEDKELIFELKNKDCGRSPFVGRDLLITNVSPLEYGHCLLVPMVENCLPQVQTEYSICLALKVMLLSGSGLFRMGFNSLCAYASVNHLHWHCYYTRNLLKLQSIPLSPARDDPLFYYIPEAEYPAVGWAFLLNSADQLEITARNVFTLVDWLSQSSVAHNVFISRAAGPSGGEGLDYVRIFVWARDKVVGTKVPGAYVIAVCELSGQILVYQEEAFKTIMEDEVAEAQTNACYEVFHSLKSKAEQIIVNNR